MEHSPPATALRLPAARHSSPLWGIRSVLTQRGAVSHRRPKSPPKKLEFPFAFAISSALCLPSHHCEAGTLARTASMCWPQPAHVVFPHTLHFTGLHMLFSLISRTLVRSCSILSNSSPDSARLRRSPASPSFKSVAFVHQRHPRSNEDCRCAPWTLPPSAKTISTQ